MIAWLSTASMNDTYEEAEARPMTAYEQRFAEAEGFHEAEQIVGRLEELGRTVELMVFDDEGHGIVKLVNRRRAYGRVAEFLTEVLDR